MIQLKTFDIISGIIFDIIILILRIITILLQFLGIQFDYYIIFTTLYNFCDLNNKNI